MGFLTRLVLAALGLWLSSELVPGLHVEGGWTLVGAALPLSSAPAGGEGQAALYGIQPEHFALSSEAEGGLPVEVVVVEPTGSETQVVARLAGQSLTAVFRERVHTKPGETLTLHPDPAKVHLFEQGTGQRLN
jgi:multiple sugar transport system ATP-binding protein